MAFPTECLWVGVWQSYSDIQKCDRAIIKQGITKSEIRIDTICIPSCPNKKN